MGRKGGRVHTSSYSSSSSSLGPYPNAKSTGGREYRGVYQQHGGDLWAKEPGCRKVISLGWWTGQVCKEMGDTTYILFFYFDNVMAQ